MICYVGKQHSRLSPPALGSSISISISSLLSPTHNIVHAFCETTMAASYGGVVSPPPPAHPAVAAVGYAQPQPQVQVRPGTLPPGTGIKIGDYEVTIEKFLSEGE